VQDNAMKKIDMIAGHIFKDNYASYLMIPNKVDAIEYMLGFVFDAPSADERTYGLQQCMTIVDDHEASGHRRAKLLKLLGDKITAPVLDGDPSALTGGEKTIVMRKLAQHAAQSDSARVQNASIITLGEILNSSQEIGADDFNAYSDIIIEQMNAEKWQTKAAAFKTMSLLVTNPGKALPDKKRTAIAINLLSLLKGRGTISHPDYISEPMRSMIISVTHLGDHQELFFSGLTNVYESLKEQPDELSAKNTFRRNVTTLQRLCNQSVMNKISFDKSRDNYSLEN
jgi:hypothetical protein